MALRLLWLAVPCLAFVQRPPPVARSAVSRRQTIRAAASTLDDKDVSELLSGAEYAMDISSITAGSEKETYIGQGSGVNEGAGVGKLAGWAKKAVGKLLTWRNKPVYDDLWDIIENDCLAVVKERVPELEMRRTWFSDEVAPYSFATDDGMCEGTVAGYKGGRVDWITTCKFFSKALGFGNMRIDGWTTRDTRAPHVAVHLCIVFNVLFIYITLVPRTNLVLDDEYNDYVYGDPSKRTGKSLNDYHVQCVEDKAFKQYISKSPSECLHVARDGPPLHGQAQEELEKVALSRPTTFGSTCRAGRRLLQGDRHEGDAGDAAADRRARACPACDPDEERRPVSSAHGQTGAHALGDPDDGHSRGERTLRATRARAGDRASGVFPRLVHKQ